MRAYSFSPFPELSTERFILRQLSVKDENEIFLLRSDSEVNKYFDRPIAKTIKDAKQFINKINETILKNELIFWAIAFRNTTKLVGTICLWNISDDCSSAEIGFELLPEYQGNGIMQEVLLKVIRYGFDVMNLQTIEGEVDPKNVRSIKLLEKYGFIYQKKLENTENYSLQNPNGKNF